MASHDSEAVLVTVAKLLIFRRNDEKFIVANWSISQHICIITQTSTAVKASSLLLRLNVTTIVSVMKVLSAMNFN